MNPTDDFFRYLGATQADTGTPQTSATSPVLQIFEQRQIREALAHAAAGGQALHLMSGSFAYLRPDTPAVFKGRSEIAHLFDQNRRRLVETAQRLGVRVIKVERDGTLKQHIDLCAGPLLRARELARVQAAQAATQPK